MPGEHVDDPDRTVAFPGARSIWWAYNFDPFALKDLEFEVSYIAHGGSGLGLGGVCKGMRLQDVYDLYERMSERRREEADAIRQASRAK